MIHDFEFTIPGQPPSVNRQYDLGYSFDGKSIYRSKNPEVTAYQLVAMNATQRAKPAEWIPREAYLPREGRGMIVIELRFFLGRDVDCDNTQKAILDAIKYGLGTEVRKARKGNSYVAPIYDDARFLARAMWKQTGVKQPRVEVAIRG